MRQERQAELLQRVAEAGPRLTGLHAPHSVVNRAEVYTDPDRFADEMRILFRHQPVFFALSVELPDPGDHRSGEVGGVPVVVVRQPDGSLRAMVNICRHRGAPVVTPGSFGRAATALLCPYHHWTYQLDGALRARPGSAGAFDDVDLDCDLHPVAVAEQYGMIFVLVGQQAGNGVQASAAALDSAPGGIDVDQVLGGAEDDLAAFGLDHYVPIESRWIERDLNWKLLLDTFTESYHIRVLHSDTIAPMFDSNCLIFDPFGRNLLAVGLRNNVFQEFDKPRHQWSLLPYGTIQYFLVPTALLVHQLDHVELWRLEPVSPSRTRALVSVLAPEQPDSERAYRHYVKNLDLLLDVTGREDFTLMEQVQRNLESGAIAQLVYGRNEAPLIHLHQAIDECLRAALP